MVKLFKNIKPSGPERLSKALEPVESPGPERYVIFRNEQPKAVIVSFPGDKHIWWMAKTQKSLPESWAVEAEAQGLIRVGYSQ